LNELEAVLRLDGSEGAHHIRSQSTIIRPGRKDEHFPPMRQLCHVSFDGANKTNFGQIVSGQGKIPIMQSGKSTQKTNKSAIESQASPEVIDALEAPPTAKRAAKPLATAPAPAKEASIAKPKSLTAKSRVTSSERATRSTSLHRAATPVTVPAESKRETPVAMAPTEEEQVVTTTAPRGFTPDDVAKLAYSYWVERGHLGGNPYDDWIRAEWELRSDR
jgi:hypothetical protein